MLVCIFPSGSSDNRYSQLQRQAIASRGFTTCNLRTLFLRGLFDDSIIIINWLETFVAPGASRISLKGIFDVICVLFVTSVTRSRVVWVKHNYRPHDATGFPLALSMKIMKILERLASKVVVHSKHAIRSSKYTYIPHPLYFENHLGGKNNYSIPLTYVCVGGIRPYKGYKQLLEIWPINKRLDIYGRSNDQQYLDTLRFIIKQRRIDAYMHVGALSDDEIATILSKTDVVVLPHLSGTAIVSGVRYLAKSFGCLLLSRLQGVGYGEASYSDRTELADSMAVLERAAKGLTRKSVFYEAERSHGQRVVACAWQNILNETAMLP